jgi:hypothetical protein
LAGGWHAVGEEPPARPAPDPTEFGSDVVIWPRSAGQGAGAQDDEPATHANEGTVPGIEDGSSGYDENPRTVGDGPMVWRPASMTPKHEKTVEAPGFSAPDLLLEPLHAGTGPVDVGTSALEELDAEASPAGRRRAILIGLLVGSAFGLIIDAILSGWLDGI